MCFKVKVQLVFLCQFRLLYCQFCWVFIFFSTEPRDWLGRTSPKLPILCRMGHKTLLHSCLWLKWLQLHHFTQEVIKLSGETVRNLISLVFLALCVPAPIKMLYLSLLTVLLLLLCWLCVFFDVRSCLEVVFYLDVLL